MSSVDRKRWKERWPLETTLCSSAFLRCAVPSGGVIFSKKRVRSVCMESCASPSDAWKKDVLWLFRDAAVIFCGHHSFRVVITLEPTTRAAAARSGLLLVRETPLRRLPCHLRAVPNRLAQPTCGTRFSKLRTTGWRVHRSRNSAMRGVWRDFL